MVLPGAGRHGGRLIYSALGLSSRMARAKRTVPALSPVLIQMRVQTHYWYPMSMIHRSAAHSQGGKLVLSFCGPAIFPAMLAMARLIALPIHVLRLTVTLVLNLTTVPHEACADGHD